MELAYQFYLIQAIRQFFANESFLDVLTPPLVENPGMEPHIHPFSVTKTFPQSQPKGYLHTSPEFHMKELLAQSPHFHKIFTVTYCFRDEPDSPQHRSQFLMLEWYRAHSRYEQIMDDVEHLIQFCHQYLKDRQVPLKNPQGLPAFERQTVQELFQEYLNLDILQFLQVSDLRRLIEKDFPEVPVPPPSDKMLWEDYYFLLFLNKIESQLVHRPYLLLSEFPRDLAALSTLKSSDPRVCERFEVYLDGIELCNCFNELVHLPQQQERFRQQNQLKRDLYHYQLPEPKVLLRSLAKGLPPSAGIALGVERLLMSLVKVKNPFFDSISSLERY